MSTRRREAVAANPTDIKLRESEYEAAQLMMSRYNNCADGPRAAAINAAAKDKISVYTLQHVVDQIVICALVFGDDPRVEEFRQAIRECVKIPAGGYELGTDRLPSDLLDAQITAMDASIPRVPRVDRVRARLLRIVFAGFADAVAPQRHETGRVSAVVPILATVHPVRPGDKDRVMASDTAPGASGDPIPRPPERYIEAARKATANPSSRSTKTLGDLLDAFADEVSLHFDSTTGPQFNALQYLYAVTDTRGGNRYDALKKLFGEVVLQLKKDRLKVRHMPIKEFADLVRHLEQEKSSNPLGKKPTWKKETGELRYGDRLEKTIRNIKTAKNVVRVLDEFELLGWPSRIDSPFQATESQRLHETLRSLNEKLSPPSFLSRRYRRRHLLEVRRLATLSRDRSQPAPLAGESWSAQECPQLRFISHNWKASP